MCFSATSGQGLGRHVAAGDPGAAGGDHHLDRGVGDPLPQPGGDRVAVVTDDGAGGEMVAGRGDALGQRVAGAVVGRGAGVGDGEHRDPQGLEGDRLVNPPGH